MTGPDPRARGSPVSARLPWPDRPSFPKPTTPVSLVSLLSNQVSNYQYNPIWGVLLDQLQVRGDPSSSPPSETR